MIAACKRFIILVTVAVHIFNGCEVFSGFQRNRNIIIYGGRGLLKATPSGYTERTLKASLVDGKFMSASGDYMLYA